MNRDSEPQEILIPPAPLLSVVIPARDVAPWIDELLDSVLGAGVDSLEVIVVNDRSTDETGDRIAAAAERDGRVRHHRASGIGAAAARNEGALLASGRYLVFADADDLIPQGAYSALVDSLESSDSDFAIGDHLKFSPGSTWSPTARWHPFDTDLQGVTPSTVPALVSGRAAWNRVFRRSFWEGNALAFPEIPRNDDMVPMTRSFVLATSMDVVASCVYLYRDRPGTTSMTAGTPAHVAARLYFEQEAICAEIVADFSDPAVTASYSRLVFDADGWVHLSTYLRQLEEGAGLSPEVAEALTAMLAVVPRDAFESATADRRALFALVEAGDIGRARSFARSSARARDERSHDSGALEEWSRALAALEHGPAASIDLERLAVDGPLTALANDAALAAVEDLVPVVSVLAGTTAISTLDPGGVESEILRWMLEAVRASDADAVRRVSLVRRATPLVVEGVEVQPDRLLLAGPAPWPEALLGAVLVLRSDAGDDIPLALALEEGRWSAEVRAQELPTSGRYRVLARFTAGDSVGAQEHAVVTARMPLPPVPEGSALQPLSDRKNGWVFLLDYRDASRGGVLSGLRAKARARLRR